MYMKKINIILITVIIALVSGLIGSLIGIKVGCNNGISNTEKDLIGTYRTSDWNGKEGIIVLNKDKTCIHPMGYTGKWFIENNKLYMEVDFPTIDEDTLSLTTDKTTKEKIEVLVVEKGLMFSSHFFEKIK